MSSLYGTGDVAVQKGLPSETAAAGSNGAVGGIARPGAQSITLEEILKGSSSTTQNSGNHVTFTSAGGTPPSPQFAPALKNYPSSSSLMAKSPSLRTLSATMSTTFDNMNRGWESDAPEGDGAGFTIGNEGMDDADGMNDNGEVPWHLMSSTEKKKLQHQQHRDRYVGLMLLLLLRAEIIFSWRAFCAVRRSSNSCMFILFNVAVPHSLHTVTAWTWRAARPEPQVAQAQRQTG
jgi:hypothetical protein